MLETTVQTGDGLPAGMPTSALGFLKSTPVSTAVSQHTEPHGELQGLHHQRSPRTMQLSACEACRHMGHMAT